MDFGGSGHIRGLDFGGSGLIRGVDFGGMALEGDNLVVFYYLTAS